MRLLKLFLRPGSLSGRWPNELNARFVAVEAVTVVLEENVIEVVSALIEAMSALIEAVSAVIEAIAEDVSALIEAIAETDTTDKVVAAETSTAVIEAAVETATTVHVTAAENGIHTAAESATAFMSTVDTTRVPAETAAAVDTTAWMTRTDVIEASVLALAHAHICNPTGSCRPLRRPRPSHQRSAETKQTALGSARLLRFPRRQMSVKRFHRPWKQLFVSAR